MVQAKTAFAREEMAVLLSASGYNKRKLISGAG